MAQWIECQPAKWKAAGSIPHQGTCLGCGPGPRLGVCERQPIDVSLSHSCFSPSLSPSLPLSLKINKTFLKITYNTYNYTDTHITTTTTTSRLWGETNRTPLSPGNCLAFYNREAPPLMGCHCKGGTNPHSGIQGWEPKKWFEGILTDTRKLSCPPSPQISFAKERGYWASPFPQNAAF